MDYINLTLREKLGLFKKVECLIEKVPEDALIYGILDSLEDVVKMIDQPLPQ